MNDEVADLEQVVLVMLLTCCLHTCSHCEFGEDSNDVACDGPDDLDEGGFVFVFQHGGYYYWHIQTDFQVSSMLLDAASLLFIKI